MDTRIPIIRRQIKTLRRNMLRTEQVMREQINREENCSVIAQELLHMRAVMSVLVQERQGLGDREPIIIDAFFSPRRPPPRQANAAKIRFRTPA